MKFKIATRIVAIVSALALVAGIALAPAGAAFADPENSNASCMGYEAAAVSPPGTSYEVPGLTELGMSAVAKAIDDLGLTTTFAQSHWGSHENCDQKILGF